MSRLKIPMKRVGGYGALSKPWRLGEFYWFFDEHNRRHIGLVIPDGDGATMIRIPVARGPAPKRERAWGWNGNEDRPTLDPSVKTSVGRPGHDGYRVIWHGYVQDGELV